MARDTDDWLSDRPPERIRSGDLRLERSRAGHLDDLLAAVNASRDELRTWMPWAQDPSSMASIGAFLNQAERDWDGGREFQFAMLTGRPDGRPDGRPSGLVGYCGLHARIGRGALEIGYWVRSDCSGHGIAAAAARELTCSALVLEGVDRVEIHCDATNGRSAAIPPRLGFRLDRIEPHPPEAPGQSGRLLVWVWPAGQAPPVRTPWRWTDPRAPGSFIS